MHHGHGTNEGVYQASVRLSISLINASEDQGDAPHCVVDATGGKTRGARMKVRQRLNLGSIAEICRSARIVKTISSKWGAAVCALIWRSSRNALVVAWDATRTQSRPAA